MSVMGSGARNGNLDHKLEQRSGKMAAPTLLTCFVGRLPECLV